MKTLYTHFPLTFFLRVLFLVLIFVVVVIIVHRLYKKNALNKCNAVITVLLALYILLVLFYTVLGRRTQENYYHLNFDVIGTYTRLFSYSDAKMAKEALLNVLMFVPIGVSVCFITETRRVFYAVIVGVSLSLLVEISQFILQNGYSEVTDLIHNTLGSLIGAVFAIIVISIYKAIHNRKARIGINE